MTRKIDIDRMRVASPCNVGWDSMVGDNRARHCGSCDRHVYNIVGLTRSEIESLVENTEGRLCVRMYQRQDATVLTEDCPVGLRLIRKRVATLAGAALSALLGLVSVGHGQKPPDISSSNVTITKVDSEKGEISGVVVDPNGAVIPGVQVELRDKKRKVRTVEANSDGVFTIGRIQPGKPYHLIVKFSGFKKTRVENLEVIAGQRITLDVLLEPAGREVVVGLFHAEPEPLIAEPTQVASRIFKGKAS